MTWISAHRSIMGRGHEKIGLPCQDASARAYFPEHGLLVGAVADGGGSLKHSEVGSALAAQYAVAALGCLVREGRDFPAHGPAPDTCKAVWQEVVTDVRHQLTHDARLCKQDPSQPATRGDIAQYGTTLIAFIAAQNWMTAMQVGDGFLVYSRPPAPGEERKFEVAFKPNRGEFVGEVTWITSSQWRADFQPDFFDGPIDFICASSDGLEKVAIVQRDQNPFPKFFGPLFNQATAAEDDPGMQQVIESVLRMPELDRYTDDDKTMVLARWSSG